MNDAPPSPPGGRIRPGGGRLVREPDDSMVSGVCSGLADWLGLDVRLVRGLAVILVLITPWTLLAYLVASFAVPERRPDEPRVRAERVTGLGDAHPALLVVGVIVAVLLFDDAWFLHPVPAAVALVGVGVWLLTRDRDRPPSDRYSNAEGDTSTTMASSPADTLTGTGRSVEPPPPGSGWSPGPTDWPTEQVPWVPEPPLEADEPRSVLGRAGFALLLLGGGLVWLLDSVDLIDVSPRTAMAVGLLGIGVVLIVAAWRGRAAGLIPIGFLLAALLVLDEAVDVPLDAGLGDRTYTVDTVGELRQDHDLLAGNMVLDLTDAPLPRTGTAEVEANLGLGDMEVRVPEDARVTVDATVEAGDLDWPGPAGTADDGTGLDRSFTLAGEPGGRRLHLDLSVGFGTLEVVRG
jgi:phage shock protein PspC (stress-responsive transcriptional regulator)